MTRRFWISRTVTWGVVALAATAAAPPAGAQAQYAYDLGIQTLVVTDLPDGSKQVTWAMGLAVPAGMPSIPLRATIWRLDASGNRTELVWDRYLGSAGPDAGSDYNCPNVDYCSQLVTACHNPSGGFCSVVTECPDGREVTQNGNCRTKNFNAGEDLCENFECLCQVTGDPCATSGGGGPQVPPGDYVLDLQPCEEDAPLDPITGQCDGPCIVCSDGDLRNNSRRF